MLEILAWQRKVVLYKKEGKLQFWGEDSPEWPGKLGITLFVCFRIQYRSWLVFSVVLYCEMWAEQRFVSVH